MHALKLLLNLLAFLSVHARTLRSEEHTSELQSLTEISYAVSLERKSVV